MRFLADQLPELITQLHLGAVLASDYPDWNTDPTPPPGLEDYAPDWIGWARWIVGFGGFFGLVACALMMIFGRSRRSNLAAEGAMGVLWVVGGLSLVAVAGSIITGIVTPGGE